MDGEGTPWVESVEQGLVKPGPDGQPIIGRRDVQIDPKQWLASRGYGTHLPLLVEAFFRTQGPVVEHGAGMFSSSVLIPLCRMADRILITIERDPRWRENIPENPRFIVETLEGVASTIGRIGLAFIDGPLEDRRKVIDGLRDHTDVFVMHDWCARQLYNYPTDWEWLRVYDMLSPSTAIASDEVDVIHPYRGMWNDGDA